MVWECIEKRREDEYVGNIVMGMEVPGERRRGEDQSGSGWIASGTTCRRVNFKLEGRARPA